MQFRILKRIATSSFLAVLVFTKFISARVLPRTPLGRLTALPRPSSYFKRALLLRERGTERGRERKERGREGRK